MFLRQSTSQVIRFGPFLDETDGVTPETGLTISQSDMQLSKDGGSYAQKNASGNATHDTDGWYSTTLNATDVDTAAELIMQVNVSGALPVWVRYYVIPAETYDALTTDGLNNISATDIVNGGAIDTTGGAVDNVTLVDTTTLNTDMRGTDNALLASGYTAPDNATISDTNNRIQSIQLDYSTFDNTVDQVIVSTNNDKSGYSILGTKTTLDDLNDIEAQDVLNAGDIDTYSLEESQKLILSASVGVLDGAATNTITIEAADNSKTRITASVDPDGNRTSVTKDATG